MLIARRFLVSLLVSSLLVSPTASGFGPSRIAILSISHPSIDEPLSAQLADRIRSELAGKGESVVSREETALRLQGSSEPLRSVLERAKGHYYSLRIGPARSLLDEALSRAERGDLTADDTMELASAYVLLGTVNYEDESSAVAAFEEAVRLDPALELNRREHSPRIRAMFQQARQRQAAKGGRPGTLKIELAPGNSQVYLDGKFRGKGLTKVDQVVPGRHYVAAKQEGYKDAVKVIDLAQGGNEEISIELEKYSAEVRPLAISNPRDSSNLVSEVSGVARRLGASQLVLVGVEPDGKRFRALLHRIDLARNGTVAEKEVSLAGNEKGIGKAARSLVAFLTTTEKPAAAVAGGKPFWKKPIFWIVGGAIVAGAGAGVGLALTHGGGNSEVSVTVGGGVPAVSINLR